MKKIVKESPEAAKNRLYDVLPLYPSNRSIATRMASPKRFFHCRPFWISATPIQQSTLMNLETVVRFHIHPFVNLLYLIIPLVPHEVSEKWQYSYTTVLQELNISIFGICPVFVKTGIRILFLKEEMKDLYRCSFLSRKHL